MFEELIHTAIKEDLGDLGDITTNSIFKNNEEIRFSVNAREEMLLSGILVAEEIFSLYGDSIKVISIRKDGDFINTGDSVISGYGKALQVLSIERILLNFIQRSSGISSYTKEFVDATQGTKVKIRSTRKTSPGLRSLYIYAVSVGGGESYRRGLYDGVMVKDNHIACLGSITECVSRIRESLGGNVVITVECDNIPQVEESLRNSIDIILLDNMNISEIKDSVKLVNSRAKVEVSGGINLHNVREVSMTGVDYISVGSITSNLLSKDIGLDII